MSCFVIDGGRPLYGSVRTQGSKNGVLPRLAAALLAEEGCRLENCPRLSDVETALALLRSLGCRAALRGSVLEADASEAAFAPVSPELAGRMRASVLFLGPMLARFGRAALPLPGGCRLGPRPIDLHLAALKALGADWRVEDGTVLCETDGLRGAEIRFPYPSVGATENALLAAAAAEGETTISGAAREPEIVELASFLRALGVSVEGAGSSELVVRGVKRFRFARHRVRPDRIAAATFLCASAACGGRVELGACEPAALGPVLRSLTEMGCTLDLGPDRILLRRMGRLKAPRPVRTGPWPAFPTDAQPLLMAACLRAEGLSRFEETVFSARYAHAAEMEKLGASLRVQGRFAEVAGVPRLHGAAREARDLRGGAALLVAALQAEGVSRVSGAEYVDRGYEAPESAFAALGARLEREKKEGKSAEQRQKKTAPPEEHRSQADRLRPGPGGDRGGRRIIF